MNCSLFTYVCIPPGGRWLKVLGCSPNVEVNHPKLPGRSCFNLLFVCLIHLKSSALGSNRTHRRSNTFRLNCMFSDKAARNWGISLPGTMTDIFFILLGKFILFLSIDKIQLFDSNKNDNTVYQNCWT